MVVSNLQIIKEFYDSFRNKDKKYLDLCDDEIQWITTEDMPNGGKYVGVKAVFEDYFPKMLSNFKEFHAIPEQFLDFKDHIMVIGKYQGISIKDKNFEVQFSHVYLLQENKIVQFRQFTDAKVISDSLK
ncbi:putative ketosteroid isomeraserelated protein-like protein [Nitrosopumilus adriaticus]|uniref:Putative ketosteroid isomeraserelated protein-like protein n=1 Tax=Nitrosopumilus adriaticus TaxID=1580092 RepID=A0A0D5C1M1_9ARCH|nr:putative ketosteroid isomeraserelated protein-like protein [Nitrosopumilus adriaticus]